MVIQGRPIGRCRSLTNRISVGWLSWPFTYRIKVRIPGESWDPLINNSIGGPVGPGFRRECDLSWLCHRSKHSDLGVTALRNEVHPTPVPRGSWSRDRKSVV